MSAGQGTAHHITARPHSTAYHITGCVRAKAVQHRLTASTAHHATCPKPWSCSPAHPCLHAGLAYPKPKTPHLVVLLSDTPIMPSTPSHVYARDMTGCLQ
jgi:hypothetical protein